MILLLYLHFLPGSPECNTLLQQMHFVIYIMVWSKNNLLSNRKIGQHECHLMIIPPSLIKHLTSMHSAQCLMFY